MIDIKCTIYVFYLKLRWYTPVHERSKPLRARRMMKAIVPRHRFPHFVPFGDVLWRAYSALQALYTIQSDYITLWIIILYSTCGTNHLFLLKTYKIINLFYFIWCVYIYYTVIFIQHNTQTQWHTISIIRYDSLCTALSNVNDCDRTSSICQIGGECA